MEYSSKKLKADIDDPRVVDDIVNKIKSQGSFDSFRRCCMFDVDTKPAYQNLRQRVETSVSNFLNEQEWTRDLNKNQLREKLRKNITESSFLETGVERIVDQVVNPKINAVFLPKIEDITYPYLGIERPKQIATLISINDIKMEISNETINSSSMDNNRTDSLMSTSSSINNQVEIKTDFLPTDLEAVSPDSDKSHSSNRQSKQINEIELPAGVAITTTATPSVLNSSFTSDKTVNLNDSGEKYDDFESPAFEPLEGRMSAVSHVNDGDDDDELSEISGLTSQDSIESVAADKPVESIDAHDDNLIAQTAAQSLETLPQIDSISPPANDTDIQQPLTVDIDAANQDSVLSQVSSNSRLSIVTYSDSNKSHGVDLSEEAQMPKFNENSSSCTSATMVTKERKPLMTSFDIKQDEIKFEGTDRRSSLTTIGEGETYSSTGTSMNDYSYFNTMSSAGVPTAPPLPPPPPPPPPPSSSTIEPVSMIGGSTTSSIVTPITAKTEKLTLTDEIPMEIECKQDLSSSNSEPMLSIDEDAIQTNDDDLMMDKLETQLELVKEPVITNIEPELVSKVKIEDPTEMNAETPPITKQNESESEVKREIKKSTTEPTFSTPPPPPPPPPLPATETSATTTNTSADRERSNNRDNSKTSPSADGNHRSTSSSSGRKDRHSSSSSSHKDKKHLSSSSSSSSSHRHSSNSSSSNKDTRRSKDDSKSSSANKSSSSSSSSSHRRDDTKSKSDSHRSSSSSSSKRSPTTNPKDHHTSSSSSNSHRSRYDDRRSSGGKSDKDRSKRSTDDQKSKDRRSDKLSRKSNESSTKSSDTKKPDDDDDHSVFHDKLIERRRSTDRDSNDGHSNGFSAKTTPSTTKVRETLSSTSSNKSSTSSSPNSSSSSSSSSSSAAVTAADTIQTPSSTNATVDQSLSAEDSIDNDPPIPPIPMPPLPEKCDDTLPTTPVLVDQILTGKDFNLDMLINQKTIDGAYDPVLKSIQETLLADAPKIKKPKFASNLFEAKRLMKVRKQIERDEKKRVEKALVMARQYMSSNMAANQSGGGGDSIERMIQQKQQGVELEFACVSTNGPSGMQPHISSPIVSPHSKTITAAAHTGAISQKATTPPQIITPAKISTDNVADEEDKNGFAGFPVKKQRYSVNREFIEFTENLHDECTQYLKTHSNYNESVYLMNASDNCKNMFRNCIANIWEYRDNERHLIKKDVCKLPMIEKLTNNVEFVDEIVGDIARRQLQQLKATKTQNESATSSKSLLPIDGKKITNANASTKNGFHKKKSTETVRNRKRKTAQQQKNSIVDDGSSKRLKHDNDELKIISSPSKMIIEQQQSPTTSEHSVGSKENKFVHKMKNAVSRSQKAQQQQQIMQHEQQKTDCSLVVEAISGEKEIFVSASVKKTTSNKDNQRYSSDDLYKPRPILTGSRSRRRGLVDAADL